MKRIIEAKNLAGVHTHTHTHTHTISLGNDKKIYNERGNISLSGKYYNTG